MFQIVLLSFKTPHKKVLLHRINTYTLCVKRDYLVDATVTVQKCADVRFYFCASMKNVSIEGCKDSTFVLAAVSGITRINDCTNCTFIVSTRVIHALNLVDCKCKYTFVYDFRKAGDRFKLNKVLI